jgi:hypothetical protein
LEVLLKPGGREDQGLDTLLSLDGEIFPMDNGYWVKIEAWRVEPNEQIPHGVRYSLTLHDRYNRRVLGFDNAHASKAGRRRFIARKTTWDHKHDEDKTTDYGFESPDQLLEDFWREAERIMTERR